MDTLTFWISAACTLLFIEVFALQLWWLCLATGCLGAMVATFFRVTLGWQIATFLVVSLIAYIALIPIYRRWHRRRLAKESHSHRTGMDALLGRRAVLTQDITPDRLGRLRIDGDHWQARAARTEEHIDRGDEVVVTDYDSIVLIVEKTSNS